MAEPSQSPQPPSSPAQTPSNLAAVPISKEKFFSVAVATTSTKYDVLPPRNQQTGASIQPISASNLQAQTSPATPTPPPGPRLMVPDSGELLASARAKLAATKEAPTLTASGSSHEAIQEFEITHLKTIKCDICQQKNTDFLYKCQDCAFNHQICSGCVETTSPKPAEGSTGRRDWSVHAKLKDAHAAYSQPVCLGRKKDGSYERNGVKFVLAQGKKGGLRQPKKTTPKRDVTPAEHKAAVRRATGGHRTSEQGRRILARATSRLEKGQDEDLKARVEAARARRDKEAEHAPEAHAGEKKRKADVLDNDDEDDIDDDGKHDIDDEKLNEDDGEDQWDELETAAAIQQSMLDIAPLRRPGRPNRSKVQHENRLHGAIFSPSRSVSRSSEYPSVADLLPIGQVPPLLTQRNRLSVPDSSASRDARTKARRETFPASPAIYSSTSLPQSRTHRHKSEMKITSRKSASRKPAARSLVSMLETRRRRDQETKSPSTESSSDSVDNHDLPPNPQYRLESSSVVHSLYPHDQQQEAEQRRKNIWAQRELQHITDEDEEDPDPYAQDRLGMSMLLQAAKFIEDREPQGQIEQERTTQLDGPTANIPAPSPEITGSDEREGLEDTSGFDHLSNIPPQTEMPAATTTTTTTISSWLGRLQHGRRSERLAIMNLRTRRYPQPKPSRGDARRSKTEQPTAAAAATATATENTNNPQETVRQRIKAIEERAAAASRGKLKRDWDPLVKSYIQEQQAKSRKTMRWLVEQESSEEGYDKGVEGGFWVESDGTGSGLGVGAGGGEGGLGDDDNDAGEGESEVGVAEMEINDIEDDGDDDDDNNDPESDPILAPGARRERARRVAEDDGDDVGTSALSGGGR